MPKYRFSFDSHAKRIRKHVISAAAATGSRRRAAILKHVEQAGVKKPTLSELLYAKELRIHRSSVSRKFL
jgi:hypothetical protein